MSDKDIQSSEQEENERKEAFLKEYGELVQKHQVDFATYPQYVPSQTVKGMWETRCITVPISIKTEEKLIPEGS